MATPKGLTTPILWRIGTEPPLNLPLAPSDPGHFPILLNEPVQGLASAS
jgi:hypothetical protein